MKLNLFTTTFLLCLFLGFSSCNETAGEKLEESIVQKSDDLEDRSDDLEDAADYVEEGVDAMEEAIEKFKEALEEVDNKEDRDKIRKRINEILDQMDFKSDSSL